MKKELGKWLKNIAKYMVTALLFSSVFADIGQTYVFICVIAASAITLGWGLYLVKDNKGTNKKKKGK